MPSDTLRIMAKILHNFGAEDLYVFVGVHSRISHDVTEYPMVHDIRAREITHLITACWPCVVLQPSLSGVTGASRLPTSNWRIAALGSYGDPMLPAKHYGKSHG